MSFQRRKQREEKCMLTYVRTLGESFLSDRILANIIQLGWGLVPIKGSPLLFKVLGIFWISDHSGSWIKMILNWFKVLRRVLTMREFLQMFCEKILRFFTIIVKLGCFLYNELNWICFHRSLHISCDATPYWTCTSKMDKDWNPLGDPLSSSSTWKSGGIVPLSLFLILAGSFWCLLCSTN